MKQHPTPRSTAARVAATASATALALLSGCSTPPPSGSTGSARPVHWGYEGEHGPAHWGKLDPAYASCEKGRTQSPIDITRAGPGTSAAWKLNYTSTSLKIAHHEHVLDIVDNGHTIQVTVDEGSTLATERNLYHLKQFHFHTPSEHTIEGKHFPMEVHFVHQSADGNFAVVSALFAEGAANPNLEKLIAHFPPAKGDTVHRPDVDLELAPFLPADVPAYSYMGSFTTPPCTENVEWFVFGRPVPASREQLDAFASRLHHNNRPVQPAHQRKVRTGTLTGGYSR